MRYSDTIEQRTPTVDANSLDVKLCIHCKHCSKSTPRSGYSSFDVCNLFTKPSKSINVVNGTLVDDTRYRSCENARLNKYLCGIEGKRFEPKEEFIQTTPSGPAIRMIKEGEAPEPPGEKKLDFGDVMICILAVLCCVALIIIAAMP